MRNGDSRLITFWFLECDCTDVGDGDGCCRSRTGAEADDDAPRGSGMFRKRSINERFASDSVVACAFAVSVVDLSAVHPWTPASALEPRGFGTGVLSTESTSSSAQIVVTGVHEVSKCRLRGESPPKLCES